MGWSLALGAFLAFGVLGLWPESMDTLALTFAAVILSLLVGFPLGIWAGRSDRVMRTLSPVLDVMQKESPNLFGDYVKVPLPDGTFEVTTPFKKV